MRKVWSFQLTYSTNGGNRSRVSKTPRVFLWFFPLTSNSIVAVHGLNGDWETTWTDTITGKMWLRDFVPIQWPNARVMSFGYDSAVTLSNSKADIDDSASDLINRLDDERQSNSAKKRPIVFVAHSLGGIVVKRVSPERFLSRGLEEKLTQQGSHACK